MSQFGVKDNILFIIPLFFCFYSRREDEDENEKRDDLSKKKEQESIELFSK